VFYLHSNCSLENNEILYKDVFGQSDILKNTKLSYSNLMKFIDKNENKLIQKIHSMNLNGKILIYTINIFQRLLSKK